MKESIITVEGRGRLRVEPDTAVIKCVVSALNGSYAEANQEMNRRVDLLRQVLPGLGLGKGDLKTTDFAVTRDHRRNPKTEQYEFVGYGARHSLELRMPLDKERLNGVMEALLGSEADAQADVSFTVGDPEPVRARLLAAAVGNARQRAEVITRAADTKLGKIVNISYGVAEVRFRSETNALLAPEPGPGAPEIEAGNYIVEDSVTVTWEILDS